MNEHDARKARGALDVFLLGYMRYDDDKAILKFHSYNNSCRVRIVRHPAFVSYWESKHDIDIKQIPWEKYSYTRKNLFILSEEIELGLTFSGSNKQEFKTKGRILIEASINNVKLVGRIDFYTLDFVYEINRRVWEDIYNKGMLTKATR